MTVTTITVNQWNIKHNVDNPHDLKPVVCVNHYQSVRVLRNASNGAILGREWGAKLNETEHYFELDLADVAQYMLQAQMIYDPRYKTPCGASCWLQLEY